MRNEPERSEAARRLFASGLKFREGAEILFLWDHTFAGNAAALCSQSAARMITALVWLEDLPVPDYDDTVAGRWHACMEAHSELRELGTEALFLLACEWAGYPQEPWEAKPDEDFVEKALAYTNHLAEVILRVAPQLAPQQELGMDMEQAPSL